MLKRKTLMLFSFGLEYSSLNSCDVNLRVKHYLHFMENYRLIKFLFDILYYAYPAGINFIVG